MRRLLLATLIVLAMSWASTTTQAAQPVARRPNVIMIVADDLGWGDLAVYGHPDVKTPNIDGLARSGMLLTSYYVNSPVCSPSRASLLTGRFAAEIGIHYAIGGAAGDLYNARPWLDENLTSIYDVFKAAGYATGHFGKWHLGARSPGATAPVPEAYGLDESATTNSSGAPLRSNGAKPERSQTSEAIVRSGMAFIDRHAQTPFFLSLWTLEPHAVLDPTEAQMKEYLHLTHEDVRDRRRSSQTVYYASLSNVDRAVGELLRHLDAKGLRRNTIVIFTSDNGPSPLWSTATGHAGAGLAGPFRGVKGSLYEGGVRVPFIMSWPATVPADRVEESVVAGVDVLPTLAHLAGVPYSKGAGIAGEDRSSIFLGKASARSGSLYWDYRGGSWGREVEKSPRLAMRKGDWKLLLNPDGSRVELYNLARDIDETANLASSEVNRVRVMSAELLTWLRTRVAEPEKATARTGSKTWRMPRPSSEDH